MEVEVLVGSGLFGVEEEGHRADQEEDCFFGEGDFHWFLFQEERIGIFVVVLKYKLCY